MQFLFGLTDIESLEQQKLPDEQKSKGARLKNRTAFTPEQSRALEEGKQKACSF